MAEIETLLNTAIKDVIRLHPAVGDILDAYHIGCGPCSVGTCLLKDIVRIHDLSAQEEREMMARVAAVLDSSAGCPGLGQAVLAAAAAAAKPAHPARTAPKTKVSPVMKKLMDEHAQIVRFLGLISALVQRMDLASEPGQRRVLEAVDFIRTFADRYHHAKEEELLFKFFDENLDILRAMHADHAQARAHVRELVEAVERQDRGRAATHLLTYRELLLAHIQKEDEILYPWMDRQLSDSQVRKLFSAFAEVDQRMAEDAARCVRFLEDLQMIFNSNVTEPVSGSASLSKL